MTGGYSYWLTNDYRLFPQNGKLTTRWAALAETLPAGCRFPSLDQPAWENSNVDELGHQFFYTSGNDPQRMIWLGRMAMIPITVLLCWAVYIWSCQLFGERGGLVSLVLAAFQSGDPGSRTARDIGRGCRLRAFFALSRMFWSTLHRVSLRRLAASGIVIGTVS